MEESLIISNKGTELSPKNQDYNQLFESMSEGTSELNKGLKTLSNSGFSFPNSSETNLVSNSNGFEEGLTSQSNSGSTISPAEKQDNAKNVLPSSSSKSDAKTYGDSAMSLTNITHAHSRSPQKLISQKAKIFSKKSIILKATHNSEKRKQWLINNNKSSKHRKESKTSKSVIDNEKDNKKLERFPEPSDEPTINHMEGLALNIIRLIQKYSVSVDNQGFDSNSNSFDSPSADLFFNQGSSTSKSNSENTNSFSSTAMNDRIRFDLVTSLRRTLPLNYLTELSKNHNFENMRWFPCTHDNCFNLYQSKGSLRRHTFSHTGERPYLCQFPGCDKSYSASDRLAEHMNSHTNQRPYKCTFPGCTKAYNDPKTLREHKRTHGDKLFICQTDNCNKSFHRKTHLKQHQRIHNRDDASGFLVNESTKILPLTSSTFNISIRSLLNNSDNSHFRVNEKTPDSS